MTDTGGAGTSMSFFGATLPAGHGWNTGIDNEPEPALPDTGPVDGEPVLAIAPVSDSVGLPAPHALYAAADFDDDSLADVTPPPCTPITALVYAPDFILEMHTIDVIFPCGVNRLMAAVNTLRGADLASHFPCLHAAMPQLHREFAILLAAPRWPCDRDASRINGCVFAAALPSPLSRESLLVAAGLPGDGTFGVFVHGLLRPLDSHHIISLVTVAILYEGWGAPASQDLAFMLASDEGWNPHTDVPGPAYAPGSHFQILTDGMPQLFEVKPGRSALMLLHPCRHCLIALPSLPLSREYWTTWCRAF